MEKLKNPTRFIKRRLGADVTLIYGDIRANDIVFYSLAPLKGYTRKRSIYTRAVRIGEPLLEGNESRLTDRRAYPFPREVTIMEAPDFTPEKETEEVPDEFERTVLGVEGPYAYVGSPEILRKFNPGGYEACLDNSSFLLDCPFDILLAHEGAHLAFYPHRKAIIPQFFDLTSEALSEEDRTDSLEEGVACRIDVEYIRKFHPELEGRYRDWRVNAQDVTYLEAYRLVTKKWGKVIKMIDLARQLNQAGH